MLFAALTKNLNIHAFVNSQMQMQSQSFTVAACLGFVDPWLIQNVCRYVKVAPSDKRACLKSFHVR